MIAEEISDHKRSEAYNRAVAILAKSAKCFQYPTVPKGSLSEQYHQGLLQIACVLDRPSFVSEHVLVHGEDELSFSPLIRAQNLVSSRIDNHNSIFVGQSKAQHCRDKQLVLVRDVKVVKVFEGKLATGKGLQFVDNEINRSLARSVWGLSFDGAFRAWPVESEGELDELGPCPPVVLDHDPVRVIQADTKVVDHVSNDQGRLIWDGEPEMSSCLPRIWVEFAPHGLEVRLDVTSKSMFKLSDVLIGPFYFEKRPPHAEFSHA